MLRALVVLSALCFPMAAFAVDTLVVRGQDGSYAPGLASAWKEEGSGVRFTLTDATDPGTVAQVLSDRLAGVQIKAEAKSVVVSGIALGRLLEQVATIDVANADPLAEIASMSGTKVGFGNPEAGGSIRAGKPVLLAALMPHEANERIEAEVVEVQRGVFPAVAVKLKVRRAAKAGPYAKKLGNSKVFAGVVAFTGTKAIDFSAESNQRNAGAYYVQPRDIVYVHVSTLSDKGASIDWIERSTK